MKSSGSCTAAAASLTSAPRAWRNALYSSAHRAAHSPSCTLTLSTVPGRPAAAGGSTITGWRRPSAERARTPSRMRPSWASPKTTLAVSAGKVVGHLDFQKEEPAAVGLALGVGAAAGRAAAVEGVAHDEVQRPQVGQLVAGDLAEADLLEVVLDPLRRQLLLEDLVAGVGARPDADVGVGALVARPAHAELGQLHTLAHRPTSSTVVLDSTTDLLISA